MRKALVFILGSLGMLVSNQFAMAQSPAFNHTTVFVVNLEKSTAFYRDVMKLEIIPEPFKDGKHTWFKIGEHNQLHVVSGATAMSPHDINIHLAFRVTSLPDFMKHLDQFQVKYGNWKQDSKTPQLRPDGIQQIYLQDPDGYWIEVNDDKF
jgi:lactoylglutathione lyase